MSTIGMDPEPDYREVTTRVVRRATRISQADVFLENWLPQLGASLRKDEWLPKIFAKMGEDPTLSEYVKPTSDDVWQFLDGVVRWLRDPGKKGIPA
jgi:hypothetical protein